MNLITRSKLIVRASVNAGLERIEDPLTILELAEQEQWATLQGLGQQLVEISTTRHLLARRLATAREGQPKFEAQAMTALGANREDLARITLQRARLHAVSIEQMEGQLEELMAQEAAMVASHQQLRLQIESFRNERLATAAQIGAATARVRAGELLTGCAGVTTDIDGAIRRATDKAHHLQARADALDAVVTTTWVSTSVTVDPIEREFAELDLKAAIDADLARLRGQMQGQKDANPGYVAEPDGSRTT